MKSSMTRDNVYIDEKVDGWSFQNLYDRVNQIISENPEITWDKITLRTVEDYGGICPSIEYLREETDEEQKHRLDYEERIKNSRRSQYEQLKKEFGE